jgi:HEXXH motif-containing protein
LRSLEELVDQPEHRVHGMRVAASGLAPSQLEPALRRIGRELREMERDGADLDSGLHVLASFDQGFDTAFAHLCGGVELLVELVPHLARDLIRHVVLLAVLRGHSAAALGSASAREFPGLVMIPEPASDLEVAEAIVHEGAHQKFFDLAVTRELLVVPRSRPPMFQPTWATAAPLWPVEQAVAAFHAYCCLAALFDEVEKRDKLQLHTFSLLPVASDRAREIGVWLGKNGECLGLDGRRFVAELSAAPIGSLAFVPGLRPRTSTIPENGEDVVVRRCGTRILVARRAQPIELSWLCTDE